MSKNKIKNEKKSKAALEPAPVVSSSAPVSESSALVVTSAPVVGEFLELTVDSLNEKQKGAYELALALVRDIDSAMGSYLTYCNYARAHLLPKETSAILKLAGFRDDQTSRIKQVVSLPQELYQPYADRKVSFNVALEKARSLKNGKEKRGAKRKLSAFRHVWKAASKLIIKNPGYTNCERVQRAGLAMVIPAKVGSDYEFQLDGVYVVVRVMAEKKQA